MAKKVLNATFNMEFKSEGLGTIEKQLQAFVAKVPKMASDVKIMGFTNVASEIKKAEIELVNAAERLVDFKQEAQSAEMSVTEFAVGFHKIATEAQSAKAKIEGLYKSAAYSQQGMATTFRRNIKAIEELGGTTLSVYKKAAKEATNLHAAMETPAGEKYVRVLNKELEKELKYLHQIQEANKIITSMKTYGASVTTRKDFRPYISKVASEKVAPKEREIASQQLNKLMNFYASLENRQKDLNYSIKVMAEEYSLSTSHVSTLTKQLNKAVKESANLGTKAPLSAFNKDLSKLSAQFKKLRDASSNPQLPPVFDQMIRALKGFDGTLATTIGKIPLLSKQLQSVGYIKQAAEVKQLSGHIGNLGADIKSLSEKLSSGIISEDAAVKEFQRIAMSVNTASSSFQGLEKVIRFTTTNIDEELAKSLTMFKKMGGSAFRVKEVTAALKDMDKILSQPGGDAKMKALLANLNKETEYLQRIKALQSSISSLGVSPNGFNVPDLRAKLVDNSKQYSSVDKKVAENALREYEAVLAKASAKQTELNNKISVMASKYGMASTEVTLYRNKVKDAAKASVELGNTTPFTNINKELTELGSKYKSVQTKMENSLNSTIENANKVADSVKKITVSEGLKEKLLGTIDEPLNKIRGTANLTEREIKELSEAFVPLKTSTKTIERVYGSLELLKDKLKSLGYEEAQLKELDNRFEELAVSVAKTGNTQPLSYFKQELQTIVGEIEKVVNSTKKLPSLSGLDIKLPEIDKDAARMMKDMIQDAAKLDRKLLQLERSYSQQVGSLERMIQAKKRWAKDTDIKKAEKALERLKQKLEQVKKTQDEFRSGKASDMSWVNNNIKQANNLEHELYRDAERAKQLKAELSSLSSIKWGTNIIKRATMYLSMYTGFYQLVTLIRNGVGAMVEFDKASRTIAAVFDISAGAAKHLEDRLIGLGKAWGGAVSDINEAALSLGRAGISAEKLVKATEVVIKMAKLTGDSIATSSSALITYQQVYGQAGETLETLGDQLAYVANQSRLSTQDIGTYSNYALAAAKSSGITMKAVNAMAIAFSNAGVNASTIGTQIRRFSSLLRDNSTATKEFFLKLGTSQQFMREAFARGGKDADKALVGLIHKLKSLGSLEFGKTIKGMDILAAQSITLLKNNADSFLTHFRRLSDGVEGELDKSDIIAKSYEATWEKLKTATSEAFAKIAESIGPKLIEIMESLATSFSNFSQNANTVKASFDALTTAAEAFFILLSGNMLKAAGVSILKSLAPSLLSLRTAFIISTEAGVGFKSMLSTVAVSAVSSIGSIFSMAGAVRALGVAFKFLLTNPIGILITTAATAFSVFSSEVEDSADAINKLNDAQSKIKTIQDKIIENDKKIREEKNKLYEVMTKLESADGGNEEKLLKEKEAIFKSIRGYEQKNKKLEEGRKLAENAAKAEKLLAEISLKQSEINGAKSSMKPGDFQAAAYLATTKKELSDLQQQFEELNKKSQLIKLKGSLEVVTNRVRTFGYLIKTFKGKVSEASFKSWEEGLSKSVSEAITLKSKIEEIKNSASGASSALEIMTKKQVMSVLSINKSIRNLVKAGMPTGDLVNYGFEAFENAVRKSKNQILAIEGNFLNTIQDNVNKAAGNIDKNTKERITSLVAESASLLDKISTASTANEAAGYLQKFNILMQKIKSLAGDSSAEMTSAADAAIENANSVANSLFNIQSDWAKTVAKLAEDTGKRYKNLVKDLTSESKSISDHFKLGQDVSESYNQFMQKIVRLFSEVNKTATKEAKDAAANMIEGINNIFNDENKKKLFSPEQLKALDEAKKKLIDVKDGKIGPKEANDAIEELDSSLLTTSGDATILKENLIGIAGAFREMQKASGQISDLGVSLTGTLIDADSIMKGYSALQKTNDLVVSFAQRQSSLSDKQQEKFKAGLQVLKEKNVEFEKGAVRATEAIGKSAQKTKDMKDAATNSSGSVKTLSNQLKKYANDAGSATQKANEYAQALRNINRTIAENYRRGTAGYDSQEESEQILEDLHTTGQGRLRYIDWLQSEIYARKRDLDGKSIELIRNGSLGDPGGLASGYAENKQLHAQALEDISAFYDDKISLIATSEQLLREQYQQGTLERFELEDSLRELDLERTRAFEEQKSMIQKENLNASLAMTGLFLNSINTTFDTLMQAGYIRSKKMFETMKAIQVASTIINTWAAASNAFAEGSKMSVFMGYAMAAAAVAEGMAHLAAIKAQQMPTAKFHTGGYVDYFSSSDSSNNVQSPLGGLKDNEIPAILQKGEYVLSKKDVNSIKDAKNRFGQPEDTGATKMQEQPKNEVVIINTIDDSVMEQWANSRAGREIINNVIERD